MGVFAQVGERDLQRGGGGGRLAWTPFCGVFMGTGEAAGLGAFFLHGFTAHRVHQTVDLLLIRNTDKCI